MSTSNLIEQMMLERTAHYLGDSGDIYGRNYERNQQNSINKAEISAIDFYLDEENKSIHLEQTVNIYDFLTKHLDRTFTAENIEKILYEVCEEQNISVFSIWEIQDLFKNYFLDEYVYDKYYDENTDDYTDDFYLSEIPYELSPSPYFKEDFKWINTYNGEEYVSQTLQFMCFTDGLNDYVLLQIHGGCDVRGGYTAPRVFEINDIDYFLLYMDTTDIYCGCGNVSLQKSGYDEICNADGDWLDDKDIYELCYVDKDNNLRCKECNAIIMEYSPDF